MQLCATYTKVYVTQDNLLGVYFTSELVYINSEGSDTTLQYTDGGVTDSRGI